MRVFLTGFCFVAVSTGFLSFASLAKGGLPEDERATRLRQQDVASLVPDNISYSLPWDTIMERDILWKKRVWRDIDATKELNAAFAPAFKTLPTSCSAAPRRGN